MILSNFFSRQITDNSNPNEITPISFDMQAILKDRYYNVGRDNKYLIQMLSQAKASGIKLPEIHVVDKGVGPNIKPERQMLKPMDLTTQINPQRKPRLEQYRADPRREMGVPIPVQMQVQSKDVNQTREQIYQNKEKVCKHL